MKTILLTLSYLLNGKNIFNLKIFIAISPLIHRYFLPTYKMLPWQLYITWQNYKISLCISTWCVKVNYRRKIEG